MDNLDDEEDLSDTDLDQVPVGTLQQLERDAIKLSQRPRPVPGSTGAVATTTRGAVSERGHTESCALVDEEDAPHPPSSDYGLDDEDVIDLDDPSATFGQYDAPFQGSRALDPAQPVQQPEVRRQVDVRLQRHEDVLDAQQFSAELEAMQERIAELEQERIRLSKELDDAKIDATTKAGAVLNLRSRNERTTKEFEAKIATLRKEQAEERAKLKNEIQTARSDQERTKTSNKFLEHDLADERERSKRLRGSANGTRPGPPVRPTSTTPKRAQKGYADGFDDHEIIALSPSKVQEKSRGNTPKLGNKRKRDAIASPSIPLIRSPTSRGSPAKTHPDDDGLEAEAEAMSKLVIQDERLQMIQYVLGHVDAEGRQTLELLSQFKIPGQDQTIAGVMLESLARIPSQDAKPVTVGVRGMCLDIWDLCRSSKYWKPLGAILQLFESMLLKERPKTHTMHFERLVILAMQTCVSVAQPRLVLTQSGVSNRPKQPVNADIDDLQVLRILQMVANSATRDVDTAKAFWQRMEHHFVLLMLNRGQPSSNIQIMLQMLADSVLDDSFGTRHVDAEAHSKQEGELVERLASLLSDILVPHSEGVTYSREDILNLRLQVLCTVRAISRVPHGSSALAQSRTFFGKLVQFLSGHIHLLYSLPPLPLPEITVVSDGEPKITSSKGPLAHDQSIACINLATRILYHVMHDHPITITEKLAAVAIGEHKFLVGLSRIAFSERLLFEAGLEDEVVEAANEILDKTLIPEEGEAVLAALETPGSSRSGQTSLSAPYAPSAPSAPD